MKDAYKHLIWFFVFSLITAVSIYLTIHPEIIGGYVWVIIPFPALMAIKELSAFFLEMQIEEIEKE